MARRTLTLIFLALIVPQILAQDQPLKVFISVDMEGIGGIGTGKMARGSGGKDYALGRKLMTGEVNAVVDAIFARGEAEVLVNDSHGDMQNLMHTELDPRVTYIQGNIKPLGMVQGLDETFDAAIFLGYHTRAGDLSGFLAHTGSGAVKGLWLNDTEVGEGGLNAAFAGALGVPVVLVAGDYDLTQEINRLFKTKTVSTKKAITPQVAHLRHPSLVRNDLSDATRASLDNLNGARPFKIGEPVHIRMRFASTTRPDILEAIPGMSRIDGFSVAYTAKNMTEAYKLIRLMYKYVSW